MLKRYEVAIRAEARDAKDDEPDEITLLTYKPSRLQAELFVEAFRCLIGMVVVDVRIVDGARKQERKKRPKQ